MYIPVWLLAGLALLVALPWLEKEWSYNRWLSSRDGSPGPDDVVCRCGIPGRHYVDSHDWDNDY